MRLLHCRTRTDNRRSFSYRRTRMSSDSSKRSPAGEALRAEIGPGAAQLPDLSKVPEPQLATFVEAVRAAKRQQRRLLEQSAEHSLRLVPALLRPAVRKALFG